MLYVMASSTVMDWTTAREMAQGIANAATPPKIRAERIACGFLTGIILGCISGWRIGYFELTFLPSRHLRWVKY
jgi:hypothetical protein